MAFYHKYRPQNFFDIANTQPQVAEFFVSSFVKGALSHAYLFTGTHGTGKTSTARILAKAVNCEKFSQTFDKQFADKKYFLKNGATFPTPCNTCEACLSITNGSCIDVVELDAASNRGIDDMRDLKERLRLLPVSVPRKVYIIDEVHMLTTESFNALLKTLEEPPSSTLFILCTTETDKVPATIQSRCTKVTFARSDISRSVAYLKYIADSEKLSVDEAAFEKIAFAAGGAYRDAAKLLEQLSVSSQPITLSLVESLSLGGSEDHVRRILDLFVGQKAADLLRVTREYEEQGVNFTELLRSLIEHIRIILLYKSGVTTIPIGAYDYAKYANAFNYQFLADLMEQLLKAYTQQKHSPLPSLSFELVIHRMFGGAVPSAPVARVASTGPVAPTKIATNEIKQKESAPVASELEMPVQSVQIVEENVAPLETGPVSLFTIQERWTEVVRLVKIYNASMASLMGKCKPISLDGKIVTLETPYTFHKDILESPKNRPVIEQAMYELLGSQLRIKASLSNTKLVPQQIENIQEVHSEDLMSAVQEIFGA